MTGRKKECSFMSASHVFVYFRMYYEFALNSIGHAEFYNVYSNSSLFNRISIISRDSSRIREAIYVESCPILHVSATKMLTIG